MYLPSTSRRLRAFIVLSLLNLATSQGQVRAEDGIVLTTQSDLNNDSYAKRIEDFWRNDHIKKDLEFESNGKVTKEDGTEKEIPDASGITIRYVQILQDKTSEKGAIVISTGRTETYLKYKEVAFDLWNNGYSIYIIDHRGQGLSDRERGLDDREKGHVKDFGLFVSDFKQLVDRVEANEHQNLFLIAHSMGGAIASLYLEQKPQNPFKAIALTSPMHKIQSSLVPGQGMWVTCPMAHVYASACDDCFVGSFVGGFLGIGGGKRYVKKLFEENEYTFDPIRYGRLVDEYERNPDVRLGDPTHGWLAGACDAGETATRDARKISKPLRLYQAANDSIVNPNGHLEFCDNLQQSGHVRCEPEGKPRPINPARHELLIEQDDARNRVLAEILQFFEAHREKR